jgi:hypothetical protein
MRWAGTTLMIIAAMAPALQDLEHCEIARTV